LRKTSQTPLPNVSLSTIKRFHRENIDKASSKQIAEAIGIDPATVRRDFSYFGELGRRGFGYDVNKLMTFFAELLNDNATTKVLLVGVGNVGRALLHYRFQERNRMQLVMAFDTDDNELVGTQTEDKIPIYGISQIKDKIAQEDIKTAILTVPSVKAQEVADLLVDAGIEGILCFSPVNLNLPRHVVVQYVDLTSELQTLLYFMKEEEKSRRNND
jgi:redox-sensing transcriptional repressor